MNKVWESYFKQLATQALHEVLGEQNETSRDVLRDVIPDNIIDRLIEPEMFEHLLWVRAAAEHKRKEQSDD